MLLSTLAMTLLAAGPTLPLATPAVTDSVPLNEWTVPWEKTRPRDPYVDPVQERVWFVGQQGNYIAYLDQKTGQFKRYELDSRAHPHTLIVDRQGIVWYAGNTASHIGRLDPKDGSITKYAMPDSTVRDPHTMVFDKAGDIWFTAQGGNAVGKLWTKTGKVQLVKVPSARSRPYGIVMDKNDRPWFDLFGTNKIGTIDPKTMELKEYALPNERSRPRRIATTSDGRIWYGDYSRGMVGALDPKTGDVREWPTPGGPSSLPYAFTGDDQDRVWFVETGGGQNQQPNRLVGFDTKTSEFFSITPVGSATPNTVRHMHYDPKTRMMWFGTDAGTIGRAVLPARKDRIVP